GAVPGHPAGPDLPPLRHELAQRRDVLEVHVLDAVLAEDADLLLLLLLPGLVVLLLLRRALLGLSRHPAVSPRLSSGRRQPSREPTSRRPRGPGRGPPEARPDLVGLDLDHRAPVPVLRLPRPHLKPTGHEDAGPAREGLRDVLGQGPPRVHGEVRGVPILPVARLVPV